MNKKIKRFAVGFAIFVVTTALLALIGHALEIEWLMFRQEIVKTESSFTYTGGSFLPVLIGLIASGLGERFYFCKQQNQKNL